MWKLWSNKAIKINTHTLIYIFNPGKWEFFKAMACSYFILRSPQEPGTFISLRSRKQPSDRKCN